MNETLASLGAEAIDWLPSKGWNEGAAGAAGAAGPDGSVAARMGAFIESTMNLHQLYLERLTGVKDEGLVLPAITGVFDTPLMDFQDAVAPVTETLSGLAGHIGRSHDFGKRRADETSGGLPAHTRPLWRGVSLDLRAQYPVGRTVTWWGVSSCTSEPKVARSFLGSRGKRTLFEVTPARAVGIRNFSAFTGEEEYILTPGTQLEVTDVESERGGLCTVRLTEVHDASTVS